MFMCVKCQCFRIGKPSRLAGPALNAGRKCTITNSRGDRDNSIARVDASMNAVIQGNDATVQRTQIGTFNSQMHVCK